MGALAVGVGFSNQPRSSPSPPAVPDTVQEWKEKALSRYNLVRVSAAVRPQACGVPCLPAAYSGGSFLASLNLET